MKLGLRNTVTLASCCLACTLAGSAGELAWQRVQTNTAPSPRVSADGAFDTARGVLVVFGGFNEYQHLKDTWEFDGTNWRMVTTAHVPSERRSHSMTYDERRHVVVMFGGYTPYVGQLNDTWEYDGRDWTRRYPAHTPPQSWQQELAYDSDRGVCVMFGSSDPFRNTTWEYDGNDWRQVFTQHAPAARAQVSLSFDPNRHRVVLFGGYDGMVYSDTWTYDGTDWYPLTTAHAPIARRAHEGVYFAALNRDVVFGGSDQHNLPWAYYNDTWGLDSDWTSIDAGPAPVPRHHFVMAYDPLHQRAIVFAGRNPGLLNDTWFLVRTAGSAPTADAGPDQVAECSSPEGTPVTLDGSNSHDPAGRPLTFAWSAPGVTFDDAAVVRPTGRFALGATEVELTVRNPDGLTDTDHANVRVADTVAPAGRITSPADGACFGIPVTITDDFSDACSARLDRSYVPEGPTVTAHGAHSIELSVHDESGNSGRASVSFTIDTRPPTVAITALRRVEGPELALSLLFRATDDDGAPGGVLHEAIALDGCTVLDGSEVGNRDGLLEDEVLAIDHAALCAAAKRCGRDTWTNPVISVRASDCAGNVGGASIVVPGTYRLTTCP